jgi:hypothetical protein
MATTSSDAVLAAIRTRLLTYAPVSGSTLAALLGTLAGSGAGGKLYLGKAPDTVTHPYGVMRLIDQPNTGLDGGFMVKGLVELMFFDRPRASHPSTPRTLVNAMADRAEEAWRKWSTYSGDGAIMARAVESRFEVPYEEPADVELAAVRLLLPFTASPQYLTRSSGQ